jgi:hypothetical protein
MGRIAARRGARSGADRAVIAIAKHRAGALDRVTTRERLT